MNLELPEVWESEHEIEVNASASVIWNLLTDVEAWKRWNSGVDRVEMNGPFAVGTKFVMVTPGQDQFTTRLVEVRENAGFVDETQVDGVRVFVDHRIEKIDSMRSRVIFSMEAFGPSCDVIGQMASADFPEVLRGLAALAESLVFANA